jgi:polyhydroxyalkanoate synthesis repressor PhaR
MAATPIRIRRYPNRRFYDRSRRCYVTLGDIEQLVREGQTIEVHDSRTGEDLTRQVLTQILLERHPDKMDFFPAALLHGLLRANDLATDFWKAYLRQALQTLEALQRNVAPLGAPFPWLSALFPPSITSHAADADGLSRRLAALEERIARLEPGPGSRSDVVVPADDARAVETLEGRVRGLEEQAGGR